MNTPSAGTPAAAEEVRVRDFGAIPGDGLDDTPGIAAAIEHARAHGLRRVRFEPGVYEFKTLPGWERGQEPARSCYLPLTDLSAIELAGAVDAHGEPATRWVKDNDLQECQPAILSVERGSDVIVRNLTVDMKPYYYSAGRVVAKQDDEVTIEVLPGHPRVDGQRAYIMGLYDLEARRAKVVRLTWDHDLPCWRAVGSEPERRLSIRHAALAQACVVGDGVFWFQGNFCGPLLHFGHITHLLVENVRILTGHGFSLTCTYCRDVTYRQVHLRPEGNRIATTCRDGFKLFCPAGNIVMDSVHNEGCLGDDGQNLHGTWLSAAAKPAGRELLVNYMDQPSWQPLTPGREVVLLDQDFAAAWRATLTACTAEGNNLRLTFDAPVPDWVEAKTPVEPQEWLPDSLHFRHCTYRSTGRFGILLRIPNTLIEHCVFEDNNAGIHLGSEWSWGYWLESTNPHNVEIRHCTFRRSRLDMRYGGQKMDVAINLACWVGSQAPGLMHDIRIHDNVFEDETVCVSLRNCRDVWFWNNTLKNCGQDLRIDPATTADIHRTAPPPTGAARSQDRGGRTWSRDDLRER